jgi:hypothetical protein
MGADGLRIESFPEVCQMQYAESYVEQWQFQCRLRPLSRDALLSGTGDYHLCYQDFSAPDLRR